MAQSNPNVVSASATAPKLADGVIGLDALESSDPVAGCTVFTHFNGPTDELSGMCAGMAVLDPGSTPHPPHQHPEEEFLIVASGTGEIECGGKTTQVGPGAIDVLRGKHHPRHHEYREGADDVLLVEVAGEIGAGDHFASGRPARAWSITSKTYPFTGSRKKKRSNGAVRSGSINSAPCCCRRCLRSANCGRG